MSTDADAPAVDYLACLLVAKSVARGAGDLIVALRKKNTREQDLSVEVKSNSTDLVTCADIASQQLIFSRLRKEFPTHRLIGEEDGDAYDRLDERATWIVDAIDGTTNYVHGINDCAVSIALAVGRRVQVGVVYNPSTDEMFCAVRGYGAFRNDAEIRASRCDGLGRALVVSEWGYERGTQGVRTMLAVNERMMVRGVRGVRQLGSGSLDMCYVGMGRVDAVYCGVAGGDAWKIWDYAAASLVAEEAGAALRTVDGGAFSIESGSMVCAAVGMVDELLAVIKG